MFLYGLKIWVILQHKAAELTMPETPFLTDNCQDWVLWGSLCTKSDAENKCCTHEQHATPCSIITCVAEAYWACHSHKHDR